MTGLVDLHAHSTFSDGTRTPEQLVDLAVEAGVRVLALTDHDTTAGHDRFRRHAEKRGVHPICGVEVSCTWDVAKAHCHLLGLGVRNDHPGLEAELEKILSSRDERNGKIVAALEERCGIEISLEAVEADAGGDVVGRPHVANVLVGEGIVATTQEAFDRYLGSGKPAYVDRYRPAPATALDLLSAAGGKPVVAHPKFLAMPPDELADRLRVWKRAGLWGLECWYHGFTDEEIDAYRALAAEVGLVPTMGSDFHGGNKTANRLGRLGPDRPLPDRCPPGLQSVE